MCAYIMYIPRLKQMSKKSLWHTAGENVLGIKCSHQGSHRVVKSGKGKEFQKCIFQAWKGMEFNAWVGKNTEYYCNLAHLPSALAFCHATQVQNMTYPPANGYRKILFGF